MASRATPSPDPSCRAEPSRAMTCRAIPRLGQPRPIKPRLTRPQPAGPSQAPPNHGPSSHAVACQTKPRQALPRRCLPDRGRRAARTSPSRCRSHTAPREPPHTGCSRTAARRHATTAPDDAPGDASAVLVTTDHPHPLRHGLRPPSVMRRPVRIVRGRDRPVRDVLPLLLHLDHRPLHHHITTSLLQLAALLAGEHFLLVLVVEHLRGFRTAGELSGPPGAADGTPGEKEGADQHADRERGRAQDDQADRSRTAQSGEDSGTDHQPLVQVFVVHWLLLFLDLLGAVAPRARDVRRARPVAPDLPVPVAVRTPLMHVALHFMVAPLIGYLRKAFTCSRINNGSDGSPTIVG